MLLCGNTLGPGFCENLQSELKPKLNILYSLPNCFLMLVYKTFLANHLTYNKNYSCKHTAKQSDPLQQMSLDCFFLCVFLFIYLFVFVSVIVQCSRVPIKNNSGTYKVIECKP